jgi:hypothetical protein
MTVVQMVLMVKILYTKIYDVHKCKGKRIQLF